ncbi:hypothetical protein EGW08_021238 [Elysia chlorotica]|uniref:Uncharacterized protein n=1 Tax=Elysia chlorotica TaxID=188477 RepID=A0A3S1B3E2_ELYCH|nr:hypothetical protein EGW08_021238 [Elysia chlorotica]
MSNCKNMTFESNQIRRSKSRWKRDGDGEKAQSELKQNEVEDNRTVTTNTSSDDFNSSYLREFYEERQAKKQLQFDAESAAICLVFISCLILFSLWYFRGFHNRNIKYREVTFHDSSHVLTVEEVLFRKRHYLPMFNQEDKMEEVFVHDCGNDP